MSIADEIKKDIKNSQDSLKKIEKCLIRLKAYTICVQPRTKKWIF